HFAMFLFYFFFFLLPPLLISPLFPYTTLFRSHFFITFLSTAEGVKLSPRLLAQYPEEMTIILQHQFWDLEVMLEDDRHLLRILRSEEHTSELQSPYDLVCRLLLEKKKNIIIST